MVPFMQNAAKFSRRMTTTPTQSAAVAIVRVLRIPGTLACPIFAR
jgi:hypothetical protein